MLEIIIVAAVLAGVYFLNKWLRSRSQENTTTPTGGTGTSGGSGGTDDTEPRTPRQPGDRRIREDK